VVLSESDVSQQAAANSLPLQDAFAVLFFVSVGMLFDPSIVVREPGRVAAVLVVVVLIKSMAALAVVLVTRRPLIAALTIAAGLAQVGEFSFLLAGLGVGLDMLPPEGREPGSRRRHAASRGPAGGPLPAWTGVAAWASPHGSPRQPAGRSAQTVRPCGGGRAWAGWGAGLPHAGGSRPALRGGGTGPPAQ
jgi:hypothetical protein